MISGSRLAAIAALCVAGLLVAVACGNSNLSSSTRSPTPAGSGVSGPTASAVGSTTSSSPSPGPSPTPESSPTAASFPVVNSCNPASVPNAIPVVAASVGARSFVLHVPILMYHRIIPVAEAGNSLRGLVVPPETFAAQLDALAGAGWQTITMATLANDLQAGVKPPPKAFVITIDDGWDDGYTYAFPILAQRSFVATYFVIAGRIDHPGFLTSAHLQALVAADDEIGDHTMSHFDLAGGSAATRHYEVDAAAARIAQVTGRWPESLAYPFGGENALAVVSVAACQELRIAVIEDLGTATKPATSPKPGTSGKPAASPTPRPTEMPVPNETWAGRFAIPRVRVSPGTTPANLLGELDRYLRAG
ncbi:MAG TPA: polysaccharide deacetylase family protein [Candidatus Limnocylindrales bacterium]